MVSQHVTIHGISLLPLGRPAGSAEPRSIEPTARKGVSLVLNEFAQLPGVPAITLSQDELAALPENTAPAPWPLVARAIFWAGRPDATARAAIEKVVPQEIRDGATPLAVYGGLIRYDRTPVGVYSEVTAVVVYRRGRHLFTTVPFMAVDSPTSVAGGRENWALPKTLATFTGEPQNHTTMSATGPGWRVAASIHAGRVPMPFVAPSLLPQVQKGPGGELYSVRLGGRGIARRARVDIAVDAPPALRDWFPEGQRSGILQTRLVSHFGVADRSTAG
ncbi:acetoacetate decarboxylase family protein [Nocardia sp. NPDC058176]|uniref:acetoacetate decarboxylase family protein n=1 Tax=Nocardia sp. NPDC058176 TaxID=3346368 RepID=UPI0036DF8249